MNKFRSLLNTMKEAQTLISESFLNDFQLPSDFLKRLGDELGISMSVNNKIYKRTTKPKEIRSSQALIIIAKSGSIWAVKKFKSKLSGEWMYSIIFSGNSGTTEYTKLKDILKLPGRGATFYDVIDPIIRDV